MTGIVRRSAPSVGELPTCLVTAAREGPRRSLLDLFAASVTCIEGAPEAIERLVVELAREVSEGTWSPPAAVVVHALGGAQIPAARRIGDVEELLARLGAGAPDGCGNGDGLGGGTVVFVDPSALSAPDLRRLVEAAKNPALGLVVAGPCAAASCRLLAEPVVERDVPPEALVHGEPGPEDRVEVLVLGPVEVRAGLGYFARRPKLTELVVYLAVHPEGATTSVWSTALWPDRRVPPQTIANRLSEARRGLGFAPDGRPRLRRHGERHQVAAVETDWASFVALAAPALGPDAWRRALELVRGRPFEGLLERQWCLLEGIASEVELAVVDCALRLGEACIAAGDPSGAEWAAIRALRACPFDERLHRLLMRAADASGNRAGVEAVFRHLALVLEVDGDPRSAVHPVTAALYDDLVRGGLA